MEISPITTQDLEFERRRDEILAEEATTAINLVERDIQEERVQGSQSLQKELLSIMNSAQEADLQRRAQEQIEAGYLDIRV